ncbi:hypothetical protein [Tissierella praeacuta]|nr:hypothetical protein [Tissierella praeacuta]
MSRYIVKKILLVIPVLIGISLITFILLNVVPGDPVTLMMKEHVKPDVIERVRQQMNLDDPAYIRFFRFL